jgi:hypothetical protein
MPTRLHSPSKCCTLVISDARDSWYSFSKLAVASARPARNRAARQPFMNSDIRPIPMMATTPDAEVKRIALRVALISLTLAGMLAWNGLLMVLVGHLLQLW